ncbi:DeoR/GlpR family transcriptional regulator of sugar metabolism [Lactobacillus colini]|uniref:DeoR/GlpR family transcriptional regulator of sugar metabolism n=1 Tax=Lactobacillus colini TaxID=1819254 RepID=A0ABS4MFP8_9LACO|nr:DeoR/GlpR family transcriptional regulator of sugar metabolism [Lactobacillus colini]
MAKTARLIKIINYLSTHPEFNIQELTNKFKIHFIVI